MTHIHERSWDYGATDAGGASKSNATGDDIMDNARLASLAALAVLAAPPTSGHAATVYADAWCYAVGEKGSSDHELDSAGCSAGFGDSTTEANADGSLAKVGVFAASFGSQHYLATARVLVEDSVTYSGPGPATLKPTFYVHGVTYEAETRGEVRVEYANQDSPDVPKVALDKQLNGPGVDKDFVSGPAISFSAGLPIDFEYDIQVWAYLGEVDFSGTLELVGIQALDASGNVIKGGTFIDEDGVDLGALAAQNAAAVGYGAAAPEPATWALMLAGFAGLGLAGARKRRRRGRTPCEDGAEAIAGFQR